MIKRIEQAIKTYFYFNRSERKGVFILLFILAGVMALPYAYRLIVPPPSFEFSISTIPSLAVSDSSYSEAGSKEMVSESFPFNPNTASDEQLISLGFTKKNIETIRRFQKSGGKFKKPEDLKKIYGLNKEVVARLIALVQFPGKSDKIRLNDSLNRKRPKTPVELNTADSQTLVALYRIGPSLAQRIIGYRESLGGFLDLNQLKEIWGFDEDILFDLKDRIYVNPQAVRLFNLNRVGADQLKTHPYFKYKISNAIVNYRIQHGEFKSLEDLKKIVPVTDSVFNRITRYLYIP